MGYWGWRPLVFGIFISTWVVGCNIVTDNTSPSAAPSNYPDVTLTVGRLPTARVSRAPTRAAPTVSSRTMTGEPASASPTPQTYVVEAGDTLAGIALQFDVSVEAIQRENGDLAPLSTLTPGQALLIPAPTALLLSITSPTCYETRPDSLVCLGLVKNPLAASVESVVVDVQLLQANGDVYLDQHSSVEQAQIESGEAAAYQVTFQANWGDFTRADATVIHAVSETENEANRHLITLTVEDAVVIPAAETLDGRMTVQATLINTGDQPAELLRAFITLIDPVGSVIGYRVVGFESGTLLAAGEQMPMQVELTPQIDEENPEALLTVEARLIES